MDLEQQDQLAQEKALVRRLQIELAAANAKHERAERSNAKLALEIANLRDIIDSADQDCDRERHFAGLWKRLAKRLFRADNQACRDVETLWMERNAFKDEVLAYEDRWQRVVELGQNLRDQGWRHPECDRSDYQDGRCEYADELLAKFDDILSEPEADVEPAPALVTAVDRRAELLAGGPVSVSDWQTTVHDLAVSKGWHERPLFDGKRYDLEGIGSKLMLVTCEVAEAIEEMRNNGAALDMYCNEGASKPEGFVVELADAVIRIMDLCGALNLDLEDAMRKKHAFNQTRPYKHGKAV